MEQQSPSTATITRRVEWVDTDASGFHHNSLIMRLVEEAEHRLVADAGIRQEYYRAAPRVRHEVDYRGRLSFDQQVTATVVCERVGRASVEYSFEVWGEAFGTEPRRRAASGRVVLLCDHSKVGAVLFCKFGDLDQIDVIVSDAGLDDETADRLSARGPDVLRV